VGRLVRELRPDLLPALHLTSYGFLGGLSGLHPFLLSVWGTAVLEAPHLAPFQHWVTRHALARADAVTAPGLHRAASTTRYAPEGKPVTVVPYGVDLERFRPAQRPPGETVVIGTTARLSEEKGLTYLVDAFARLRERYGERVRLRIAGEGPGRRKLEQQIAHLGLGQAVELAGWLEHDDVPGFLQELDVFALPSTWEGFGVSAIEASATGLPVVASNVHGIPDAVLDGRTGILVPPRDVNALASVLSRLVEDPVERAAMGQAGRAFVAANYSWDKNAEQMERLYAGLVSHERS